MNFCTTLNLVNNILFSPPLRISFLLKGPGAELKNQGSLGGQKFVVENSLHLTHHCSHYHNIWRAQVKVGLINLCKGLFSLNACIFYKLKSGT